MKGVVKWFKDDKGFGFISAEDGFEYFCHYSEIISNGYKKLTADQTVEFDPVDGPKGLSASNVVVIGDQ